MPSQLATDLASAVADTLLEHDLVLGVAESCTAGAVTSALAAGGSAETWLRGGILAYQDVVKRELLGVTARSVVTPEAAEEMARGAARLFSTDLALATTGVFGDEPVDGVEPTTVVIATLVDREVVSESHHLDDDPEQAADEAVARALAQLLAHLRANGPVATDRRKRSRVSSDPPAGSAARTSELEDP